MTQTVQGTSADQDNRFSDKEKKLMNSMRFEESLAKKVDMKKVTPFYCQEIFMLPRNVSTTLLHELQFWRWWRRARQCPRLNQWYIEIFPFRSSWMFWSPGSPRGRRNCWRWRTTLWSSSSSISLRRRWGSTMVLGVLDVGLVVEKLNFINSTDDVLLLYVTMGEKYQYLASFWY